MKTGFIVLTVLVAHFTFGATLNLEGEYNGEGGNIFYDIKSTTTIKCIADEPIANTIKWFKNSTNIKDLSTFGEHYQISVSGNKKESKLTIIKLSNQDAGSYSCRVKGKEDERVNFELIGNVAVKLPSNTMTVEGETLRILCASAGTKIKIHWEMNTLNGNSSFDAEGYHDDER